MDDRGRHGEAKNSPTRSFAARSSRDRACWLLAVANAWSSNDCAWVLLPGAPQTSNARAFSRCSSASNIRSLFALERGAKFRHCCFPSPLKKPKSTATLLAWDDGGLIMHFIMSALAFFFLFAVSFRLI